ncbi:MAG: phosphatidylserine/phosphatidylglycerophosphate/cardiolipin synthase family protein, partial [Candidatus Dadabacteria bacterium]
TEDTNESQQRGLFTSIVDSLFGRVELTTGEQRDSFWDGVRAFIERQTLAGAYLSFGGQGPRDAVVARGRELTLRYRPGTIRAPLIREVRFLAGDRELGVAAPGADGLAVLHTTAITAGVAPLRIELVGTSGESVAAPQEGVSSVVHVLGSGPLILISVEPLFANTPSDWADTLHTLIDQGADLLYIDLGRAERGSKIVERLKRYGWPRRGVLSVAPEREKFESWSVNFRPVFLDLTIRRLMADGVPVVGAVVTEREFASGWCDDIFYADAPQDLYDRLEDLVAQAQRLVARAAAAEELDWRIQQYCRQAPRASGAVEFNCDNRAAREELFEAIEQASRTIDLQFYIFREGRFTRELAVLLARASARGVRTRLLVDALWSNENFLGTWNDFLHKVSRIDNIEIASVDPVRLTDSLDALRLRQRDHRKIAIVDDSVAWVGGRNAADEYWHDWCEVPIADWTEAEEIPWLDAHIRVEGAAVDSLSDMFERTWQRAQAGQPAESTLPPGGREGPIRLIVHDGTRDANALAAYEALITGAQEHLLLVNDFPVFERIAELLTAAVRRGVRVQFLTGSVLARRLDGTFFRGGRHRELFEYVTKQRFGALADAGIEVYEFVAGPCRRMAVQGERVRPYVHAKLSVADRRVVCGGSANLDATASFWERECNLLVDDPTFADEVCNALQPLLDHALRLDTSSHEWRREAAQREIAARLWPDAYLS